MASIAKRPDGRWRARYRDPSGKEHAKHFDRKVDAQRWLDEQTAAIVTGQYVDPRAGKITLRAYAAGWEAAQVGRDGTARIIDNALRLHILPAHGDRPMNSLKPSDVQGLVKRLSLELAPGSVRNIYDVYARLCAAAVDDKVIATSPCRRITLPREDEEEVAVPPVGHVLAMADHLPPRYRAGVVALSGSGLRIGELLGLKRKGDVDFLRKTIRVERQRLQNGEIGPPKTPKSVRTVPVGDVVIEALAAHLAAGYGSDEWMFTAEDGGPLLYRRWKRVWGNARTEAGELAAFVAARRPGKPWPAIARELHEETAGERDVSGETLEAWFGESTKGIADLDTHELRHFFASALISGGASVKQVQTVLGHSSAVITLRTYAHLWPGDEDRTRSVVDAALGVLRTGCGPGEEVTDKPAGQSG